MQCSVDYIAVYQTLEGKEYTKYYHYPYNKKEVKEFAYSWRTNPTDILVSVQLTEKEQERVNKETYSLAVYVGYGTVACARGFCQKCKSFYETKDFSLEGHDSWASGEKDIYEALPLLSKEDIEFILSTLCPDCSYMENVKAKRIYG